jgi:hypothetical protein
MWLQVADAAEAGTLVRALAELLEGQSASVSEEASQTVSVLWAEGEVDDADEGEDWDEQAYAELMFFLRAWSGRNPRREVTVLAEGVVDVAEAFFRRAS